MDMTLSKIFLVAALMGASPAFGASAQLKISVTVLPHVNLSAVQRVTSYLADSAALERGYVDIPNALTVTIRTNVRDAVFAVDGALVKTGTDSWGNTFTLDTADFRPGSVITKIYSSG